MRRPVGASDRRAPTFGLMAASSTLALPAPTGGRSGSGQWRDSGRLAAGRKEMMMSTTRRTRWLRTVRRRLHVLQEQGEAGMATAEYAIATLAAAGFAGLLLVILRSTEVREFLLGIIRQALQVG